MILNDFISESSGYSLQGSFTSDLTKSKIWLLYELGKLVDHVDVVYILGSWYGNISLYMILQPEFQFDKIINVEKNKSMLQQSRRMLKRVGGDNVEHMLVNANNIDYRQLGNNGLVINTSLTDMPGRGWFDNIPQGTLVALQARDHDLGRQFHSTKNIIDQFPMDKILYQGSLKLTDPETNYTRFMVIGRK